MNKKAIALISGGLDSLLAARVVMEQGIEVEGVTFIMQFASKDMDSFISKVTESAKNAGIKNEFVDISEEFLKMIEHPKHGYGANLNPCIDCKILMLQTAKKIMKKKKAGFIITGEVLGERPMSQRRAALDIIKRDSELEDLLLRPLSARALVETIPEKEGIVDRTRLMKIIGRSRKEQYKLAKQFDINKYFAPGGGCLLTDRGFSGRLKDLIDLGEMNKENILLLKYGRHFRLDKKTKVVIGRDERENEVIEKLKTKKDILVRLQEDPGPYGLLRGDITEKNIEKTASLVVSHSKKRELNDVFVEFWNKDNDITLIKVNPFEVEKIEEIRI